MNRQQLTSPWETEYNDFDYDHVDPETLKEWEAEFRRKNWSDMRSYLKQFPDATPEEKRHCAAGFEAVTVPTRTATSLPLNPAARWISLMLCVSWRMNTRNT